MGSFDKLKKTLDEKNKFLLICHIEPDADAIGSMSALAEALESTGKVVYRVCGDPVPEIFSFLPGAELVTSVWPDEFDAAILLDNGDFRRTGFADRILAAKNKGIPIVNIDHHPKNDIWRIATVNYADEKTSSTCEIIYGVMTAFNYPISSTIATSLLAGIFYDTGSFQHQNTSEYVLEITAELLRKGAKLKLISKKMVNARSVALFRLWGIALSRLTVNEEYQISYSVLTQEDLQSTQASEEEILGLISLLNTNASSRAALLLYETRNGKIKGSLRTERSDINLSKFASLFGGGGHRKAAGFMVDGKILEENGHWVVR